MKKNKIAYLLTSFVFITSLVSCNPTNISSTNSSNPTSSKEVSYIEINGANTLQVGQETTLVANTKVSWTSSNESIATIDSNGKVKAIEQGSVVFTATSIANPSLKATHTITISYKLPKSEQLSIEFEGENISYDASNKKYILPLGIQIKCKVVTSPNYKTPAVSFSVTFLDSSQSTSIVSIENVDDTTCLITGNGDCKDVTISANCSFDDDNSNNVKISADFDIVDLNKEDKQKAFTKLDSTISKENSSLKQASIISKTTTTKLDDNSKKENQVNYSFDLFNNATYASVDNNGNIENYYSGIKDNKYYLFSYDSSKNINSLLTNSSVSEENNYLKQANSIFYFNNTTTYTLSGLIQDLFDSSISLGDQLTNFGDSSCYANAKFNITDSLLSISSSYKEDDISYLLNLDVNFENDAISSFTFTQTSTSLTNKVEYSLSSSSLVYGDKLEDNSTNNSSYIDFSKYYFTSLGVNCLSGTIKEGVYDYSDTAKFGGTSGEYNASSKTYSLPIYKSLPLKIDDSLGNSGIDEVKISANNTNIDVPTITNDGILLFSAKTVRELQEDGTYKAIVKEGSTTFTLTSSKNKVTYSFTVEFKKSNITSLEITDNKPSNNDFGNVHQNEYSSYFSLKALPSDDANDYSYEIVDENDQLIDSLSVYQYQDGNIDGISSYSYSIIGTTIGSYRFKIRAKGTSVTTEVFTINIIAPISKQTLIDNLVGKKYVKRGDTSSQEIEFVSETELKITYTDLNGESSSASAKITFKDGGVYVDELVDTVNNYKGQKFDDFYYLYIYGGKLQINDDYSTIGIYLSDKNGAYYKVEFSKDESDKIDYENLPTYLNGKSYIETNFIPSRVDVSLSLTSSSGKLTGSNLTTGVSIDIDFTYSYKYENGYGYFTVLSSTTSNSSPYDYNVSDISIEQQNNKLKIKIINSNESSWYMLEYKI